MSNFINFENLKLKKSKNQFLILPKDYKNKILPDLFSPVFLCNINELQDKWFSLINKQDNILNVTLDKELHKYKCIQCTKFFRFPDIIDVEFFEKNTDSSELAIYSRSKYGYYDFNVNKKRIYSWLNKIKKIIPVS